MNVTFDPVFGCELVTGRLDKDGYALERGRRAHVVAWESAHGDVPEDLVLDHLCRRRNCRALHHLEPVTKNENERRKSFAYRLKRKTCPKGHDLAANRVVIGTSGGVVCRLCNQEAREYG